MNVHVSSPNRHRLSASNRNRRLRHPSGARTATRALSFPLSKLAFALEPTQARLSCMMEGPLPIRRRTNASRRDAYPP